MSNVDKLVYLIRQGVITIKQVAEQYRAEVLQRTAPVAEEEA